MIEVSAGQARVSGAMTLVNAKTLLGEGTTLISDSVTAFDLSAVTEVDSSGLAIVFGWLREAQRLDKSIRILNLPANLSSLAQVYGVGDLLPLA